MSEFLNDIRSGALPASEIPNYLLWLVRKNVANTISAIAIAAELTLIALVITGWLPV